MTILTLRCACEDGVVYMSRYGGNDPDTWPALCQACGGSGEITRFCEGLMCSAPAEELVTFPCNSVEPYCRLCAQTAREDAGMDCEPRGFW